MHRKAVQHLQKKVTTAVYLFQLWGPIFWGHNSIDFSLEKLEIEKDFLQPISEKFNSYGLTSRRQRTMPLGRNPCGTFANIRLVNLNGGKVIHISESLLKD